MGIRSTWSGSRDGEAHHSAALSSSHYKQCWTTPKRRKDGYLGKKIIQGMLFFPSERLGHCHVLHTHAVEPLEMAMPRRVRSCETCKGLTLRMSMRDMTETL